MSERVCPFFRIICTLCFFKDYELCEEWGHLYPVPREDLISFHREHLLHLLDMRDMEKALQVIAISALHIYIK